MYVMSWYIDFTEWRGKQWADLSILLSEGDWPADTLTLQREGKMASRHIGTPLQSESVILLASNDW